MSASVSIIIPCYNAARWIGAAIDSALTQTCPENQIIVVDDGSTDDSLRIARTYESRGVSVVTQTNRGAAAARNAGLKIAQGDFIQFLDADDILAPDKIALQIKSVLNKPEHIASASWGEFHDDPKKAKFTRNPIWSSFSPVEWLVCSWQGGGMMHPAAWLVPRKIADAAGPWNENLSLDDDGEYFSRVILCSKGVVFVPEAKSFYRTHAGVRLSGSAGPKAAESSYAACTLKELHLLATEDSPRTHHALAANYSRFAWEQLVAAPELAEHAIMHWQKLDPTVKPPRGGKLYNVISSVFGWRTARRLQLRRQCRS
ncbi:MAG: glycosyltransferase family A protein [Chthoniobacterales bacterium]